MIKANIFFIYRSNDESFFKQLATQLHPLEKNRKLSISHVGMLSFGVSKEEQIIQYINEADIIIPLISADFLASNLLYNTLQKHTSKQQEQGINNVFPVIVRSCLWEETYIKRLKVLPQNQKPINQWSCVEDALHQVAEEIELLVEGYRNRKEAVPNPTAQITDVEQKRTVLTKNRLNKHPFPRDFFSGRVAKLEEFKNDLVQSKILGIYGLGGVGKTEFAAKCIDTFIEDKNRIIWLHCTEDSRFSTFIEAIGLGYLQQNNSTEGTLFNALLQQLENCEAIIFWDDYDKIKDPTFNRFIKYVDRYFRLARLILISRIRIVQTGVTVNPINLEGLSKEEALKYAQSIKQEKALFINTDKATLKEICEQLQGHPFCIESVMQLLQNEETWEGVKEKISSYKSLTPHLFRTLFHDIFNHPNTSSIERQVLLFLSVFNQPTSKNALSYVLDNFNLTFALHSLQNKLMIRINRNTEGSILYDITHSLVSDFCYDLIEDKNPFHYKVATYWTTQRNDSLDIHLESQVLHHFSKCEQWTTIAETIQNNGLTFIRAGHYNMLYERIHHLRKNDIDSPFLSLLLGKVTHIKGEWRKALDYLASAYLTKDPISKAEALIEQGLIWTEQGKNKTALDAYAQAYDIGESANLLFIKAKSANRIGAYYWRVGEITKAIQNLQEALQLFKDMNNTLDESINVKKQKGLADVCSEIGNVFSSTNRYDQAIEMYNKSLNISKKTSDKSNIAIIHTNIGNIYYIQNELPQAQAKFKQGLATFQAMGDQVNIAQTLNNLGIIERALGNYDQALKYYLQSQDISERIDNKRVLARSLCYIGNTYGLLKKFDLAISYYEKSLVISKLMKDKINISDILFSLASIEEKKQNILKAIELQHQSLALRNTLGDNSRIAESHCHLALLYEKTKSYKTCFYHLLEAIAINQQINEDNTEMIALWQTLEIDLGNATFQQYTHQAMECLPKKKQVLLGKANLNLKYFKTNTTMFDFTEIKKEVNKEKI